jgi:glycosyltransferase involved in cell wall biosynthesis
LADKTRTVLVVIPALNEGPHIAKVIKSIPRIIKVGALSFSTVVLVVDDGSTDATVDEAHKTDAIVLSHVVNTGAGGATRTGLHYAERYVDNLTYVITIDGDGQHASGDIKQLVEYAVKHKSEMIVGSRLHAGNKANMPLQRRFINWGGSLVSRILFGIKTKDTQSGMRLYSKETLPKISNYMLDRYGFCTETLWHAVRSGVRVDEVPIVVHYSKEGIARGQSIWASMEILRDLVRIRIAG